ncbi:hypothetical protein NBRC110019_16120 [Neptunitalea chrysea]|uniref:Uncharacterized protein n=1 Tax=Neptunitalea chrysea TaxID=1647581 RepID=A0A9W6B793_9FLAO|nr:hypothetical protein NBRC110019_16120 [Neptunitalea chrysea]
MVTELGHCFPVHSCYATDYNDFSLLPLAIRKNYLKYLENRLGDTLSKKVVFQSCTMYTNTEEAIVTPTKTMATILLQRDNPPKHPTVLNCDSNMPYPIYAARYSFYWPEKGIKEYDFCILLDKNGSPIVDIPLPRKEELLQMHPIEEVITAMIDRGIAAKDATIHLWYDRYTETLVWRAFEIANNENAENVGHLPIVKKQFSLNAFTGTITEHKPNGL